MEYPAHRAMIFRLVRAAGVLVLLALALPMQGQNRARAYFTLSSNETFGSGETARFSFWSRNVESLDFRVYKVNDPVKFFANLEETQNFGGRVPDLPVERTPIERFHEFKRRWFKRVRDFFRQQYTATSRAKIRDILVASEVVPEETISSFARAPLLNPSQVVRTWTLHPRQGRYWNSDTVSVELPGEGLYLVEAVHEELRAYTIVLVSDTVLVTKSSPGEILSFVVDRKTGAPVEGAEIRVWSKKKEMATARTDRDGLARTPLRDPSPEGTVVLARSGNSFTADSIWDWYLNNEEDRFLLGYIYSERPVYRPGHTVYWKGILRTNRRGEYQPPETLEANVRIEGPDRKTVLQKSYPVSSMGTLHSEFTLAEDAALGYYSIAIQVGERSAWGGFHVEEYKKPEYEVRVVPGQVRVQQGDPVRATIQAKYYFGEPVAGAKVTYVVHRSRYWYPRFYDPDEFGEGEEGYYGGDQILEEEGELNAGGELEISIPTDANPQQWDWRYRIEARVTDEARREISGFGSVLVTYADFVMDIRNVRYVYEPGETAAFNVEAVDYDGEPIETPFTVELTRYYWQETKRETLNQITGNTDARGQARVEIPVTESGSFRVRVSAAAGRGREAWDYTYVWVTGGEAGSWWGGSRERIQIIPDKKSYEPGETAKLLVATGVDRSHLLVTVEGEILHDARVIPGEGQSVTIEVPVVAKYQPGFFVGVTFLQGGRLFEGNRKIKVPPTRRRITVELETDKEQYRPGEPAVYDITTRDYRGRPVSAEVSLGVVDEAIYSIRRETVEDIVDYFYGTIISRINTSSSLNYYFRGEAGERTMQLTSVNRRTTPAQLKPEQLVEPEIRKDFRDTVLWLADIRTDANGRARARLTFPDNLTTWRATARSITRDTLVGSVVLKTVVRKNLLVRLSAPRFFTQGDEVVISSIVHNYLATDKQARVSLDIKGLELLEGTTQDVTVPQSGEVRVDWRVRAGDGTEAVLLTKALTDEESDGMEWTLPIHPYGVRLYEARSGALREAETETDVRLTFPDDIVPSSRKLKIDLSPSVAGTIFGALKFLTSYPYGCTEQTMSSFLPNIIVKQSMKELKLQAGIDEAELARKVSKGLERLYDFQHEDGGWGWWQTDDSHAFMTAYVLSGLVQAKQAEYDIDAYAIARGRQWLRGEFDRNPRVVADLRAYLAYSLALAGERDPKVFDSVWEGREKMSAFGWALLGLSFEILRDARTDQVATHLESIVSDDGTEASWALDHDPLMGYHGNTTAESTAYVAKFLSRTRPKSEILPRAVLWLVSHRDQGYYWSSTKQTAMVIFGLIDYVKMSGELDPQFTATVEVNGRPVMTKRFTKQDALSPSSEGMVLGADNLGGDTNTIRFRRQGSGTLYWSAREEYYSTSEKLERTGSIRLNLLRDYYRLVPQQRGEKIVYDLQPLEGDLASGDVLAVRLTLTGDDWDYLMIEDPIPAGTEFIERDDLYELPNKPPWWHYWYTRREFHDNRAVFFLRSFRRNQTQFFYLLKVVNPGRFRVSPARAEPMYQPQYLSTSESRVVVVKE